MIFHINDIIYTSECTNNSDDERIKPLPHKQQHYIRRDRAIFAFTRRTFRDFSRANAMNGKIYL